MYESIRPLLFRLDPEVAHQLTLSLLRWGGNVAPARAMLRGLFEVDDPRLHVNVWGLRFKNPIGLAAGYDKNGTAVRGLAALGFGHIEVGTVTRLPQIGNEKPRVWRVPAANALVNRMGFPNKGIERLELPNTEARLGVNIGKGRDTPLENAAEDYIALLQRVDERADYVAINVSSPNTHGLRDLQARANIEPLLKKIADARDALPRRIPLLVKIAPDLSDEEIEGIVDAARDVNFDGIIATNTTIGREGLPEAARGLAGGMSGEPLRARSTQVIHHIAQYTRHEFPIIGVGGIHDAESAAEKLRAGAMLIQVFTGLVYQGPGLVKQIHQALLREPVAERQVILNTV